MDLLEDVRIPDQISNIKCVKQNAWGKYAYVVNEGKENEIIIYRPELRPETLVEIEELKRKRAELIECGQRFKSGYKLVKRATGEYGYIDKKTKELLPQCFDVATEFNKYGLAMVAKAGNVTWINKEFSFLGISGSWLPGEITNNHICFSKVSEFCANRYRLAQLNTGLKICYLTPSGTIKKFHSYNDGLFDYTTTCLEPELTEIDRIGHAMSKDQVFFANGFSCSIEEAIDILEEKSIDVHKQDRFGIYRKIECFLVKRTIEKKYMERESANKSEPNLVKK